MNTIPTAAISTAAQRVDMERHDAVRLSIEVMFRRPPDLPREVVRTHVVALLLDSCHKQARWSRGVAA